MVWNMQPFWIIFCSVFRCNIIKLIIFYIIYLFYLFRQFELNTFPTFVPYRYDFIPSTLCNILLSLKLNANLLTFSVNTLCASLLKLCYDLNILLIFFRQFLQSSNFAFYYTFFVSFAFNRHSHHLSNNNTCLVLMELWIFH